MKKLLSILLTFCFFVACNNEEPSIKNEAVDSNLLGIWQVEFSQTIVGVKMNVDGSLEPIDKNNVVTLTFPGTPQTAISSYMFGKEENIVEIRDDHKIKIYRINAQSGVTISNEQAFYYISNDTLYRNLSDYNIPHKYQLQDESLTIERIPSKNNAWTYTISKYVRVDL